MDNMVPLAPLFDTVGWMTRDLATLQKVAKVLLPKLYSNGAVQPLNVAKKVAVLKPQLAEKELWRVSHQTWLDKQTSLTQVLEIPLSSDWLTQASECFRILQGYNLWQTHQTWMVQTKPKFAADIQARLDWCQTISQQAFEQAAQQRVDIELQISTWFDQVDFVVMPTTPSASPLLNATNEWMANYRSKLMGLTAPAGLAGLPQLHLPVLSDEGAPFGLSLLGRKHSEAELLNCAQQLIGCD
jgi:aspartyl-tRNA(Asn)/glutamyl-tRNA(Gln) amidotransferase subunit A